MITCKSSKTLCVMKLSHFLRYYQNTHGVPLLADEADEKAARLGIVIDRSGELNPATGMAAESKNRPPGCAIARGPGA